MTGAACVCDAHVQVCKYTGHTDQIQTLEMLEEKGQYLSCSWDRSLRVWACPKGKGKEARVQDAAVVHEAVRDDEEVRAPTPGTLSVWPSGVEGGSRAMAASSRRFARTLRRLAGGALRDGHPGG